MNLLCLTLLACIFTIVNCASIESQQIDPKFVSNIINFGTDFWNLIIAEPINTLASNLAGMGALLFAGIAEQGFGKRELNDSINNAIVQIKDKFYELLYDLARKVALFLTLAFQASNGRRNVVDEELARGLLSNIGDNIFNVVNSGVQGLSFQIAQLLLHISENGILPTFGK